MRLVTSVQMLQRESPGFMVRFMVYLRCWTRGAYSEIVQQISAVKAGLDSAVEVILEDIVEDCISKSGRNRSLNEPIAQLREVIARTL